VNKLRIIALVLLLAIFLISATPVYADTLDPDSTPAIQSFNVYRNLLETGDWLLIIYANIPYGTLPDTPVTQTFIWRMIALDGVTELGDTVGYAYNDDGYGYNVYSMYWSAAEVTANGMVWNTAYTVRLSGNPSVFDTPPTYNYTIAIGDYSAFTVTTDVQAELAARLLTIAGELDTHWGVPVVPSLLSEAEAGTVLSIYGEAFYRGAIFGVQNLAPAIFSVIIRNLNVVDRTWTDNYSGNLTTMWGGTWIDTAQAAGMALFGTDYDLLSIIMLLAMSVGLLIANISISGDHWNGLTDVAIFMVIGARLAMFDFAFLLLVAALCWIYISAKIWLGLVPG